jgi:hypothetical protein
MKHAIATCIGGTSICFPLANEKGEMVANHNDFTLTGWLHHKVTTPFRDPFKYPVFQEIDAVVPRFGQKHLIQKKEWAFMARVGGMGAPVPGTCWMPSPKGVPMVSV